MTVNYMTVLSIWNYQKNGRNIFISLLIPILDTQYLVTICYLL